jgi:hypothetical protein
VTGSPIDELRQDAAKNAADFGFVTPTTNPSRRIVRVPFGTTVASSISASERRARIVRTPR